MSTRRLFSLGVWILLLIAIAFGCRSGRARQSASGSSKTATAATPSARAADRAWQQSASTQPSGEAGPSPSAVATVHGPVHPFGYYFGRWRITTFEHLGASAGLDDKHARTQLGKAMTLSEKQISFDQGFLSFNKNVNRPTCNNPNYSWASEDEISEDWQMILPPRHPQKAVGDVQRLKITCGSKDLIETRGLRSVSGEVTATNGLVFFYDGYYFFASKEAP